MNSMVEEASTGMDTQWTETRGVKERVTGG